MAKTAKANCGLKAEKRSGGAGWCVVHASSGLTVAKGSKSRGQAEYVLASIQALADWTLGKDDLLQAITSAGSLPYINEAASSAARSYVAAPDKPKRDVAPKGSKAGTFRSAHGNATHTVDCYHVGSLAVHKTVNAADDGNSFMLGKFWRISHAATGLGFGGAYFDTKTDAVSVALMLVARFNPPADADQSVMVIWINRAVGLIEAIREINKNPKLAAYMARTATPIAPPIAPKA